MRALAARAAGTYLLIGLTLVGAVVIDLVLQPLDQFVATPFAIPVLIASARLGTRGALLTSLLSLGAAAFSASLGSSPIAPSAFHLASLVVISTLAILLGQARRTAAQREQESAEQRAHLEAILRCASNGVIYVNAADDRVTANAEATRLFGRELDPAAGRAGYLDQLRRADGQPIPLDELPSSRALRGEAVTQMELRLSQPNGREIPVLVSAAPVRGADGRHFGAVVVFHDISAIRELERLREEWTSIIAHDLRQPITMILGYASLLGSRSRAPSDPSQRRPAEHITAAARNLDRMIGDLLDFSAITAPRLSRQTVDFSQLVQSVVERASEATFDHPVRVRTEGSIPALSVDPGRVEQVLVNLLTNAAKYGDPGSEITVTIRRVDGLVDLSVTNRGPGIPPQEIPNLFTRFYRASSARAANVSGLGLGLYITRQLVEAHGGRVWVESSPGEDTTFHAAFPVGPVEAGPG